jgi:hypothetical protein
MESGIANHAGIVGGMRGLLAALLLAAPAAQEVEAQKEKIGETLRFLAEERRAAKGDWAREAELLRLYQPLTDDLRRRVAELAGPDPARQSALVEELLAKYVPEESKIVRIASNERWATATLARIHSTQELFRAADLDDDGKANYWVGDISALYRLRGKGVDSMYIAVETARADARPSVPLDREGAPSTSPTLRFVRAGTAQPSQGYLYEALAAYDVPGGEPARYDTGEGRNPSKYGVCAYPAVYGTSGTMTFIRSEAAKPNAWKKDTAGRPPVSFPADPARAGWTAVE